MRVRGANTGAEAVVFLSSAASSRAGLPLSVVPIMASRPLSSEASPQSFAAENSMGLVCGSRWHDANAVCDVLVHLCDGMMRMRRATWSEDAELFRAVTQNDGYRIP